MPLLPERDRYQGCPLPPLHFEARGLPRSKAVIFPVFSPGAVRSLDAAGAFLCPFFGAQKRKSEFFRKKYCFFGRVMVLYQSRHDATEYGRLAQLVEHLLDVQEVTGSSPVPSTTSPNHSVWVFFCGGRYRTRTAAEPTAACGGNREARLGPRSDFSRPRQGAAEKSANATRQGRAPQLQLP